MHIPWPTAPPLGVYVLKSTHIYLDATSHFGMIKARRPSFFNLPLSIHSATSFLHPPTPIALPSENLRLHQSHLRPLGFPNHRAHVLSIAVLALDTRGDLRS